MRNQIFLVFMVSAFILGLLYATFAIITYDEQPQMKIDTVYVEKVRYINHVEHDTTIVFTEEDSILSSY